MIAVRPARPADAVAIGAVHVAVWRSVYAGILPDAYLARLSVSRHAAHYGAGMRAGAGTFVATMDEADRPPGSSNRIVGFATCGRARGGGGALAEGEIETLYVLDDWRDQGVGRALMEAAAAHLRGLGCQSAFLWVLRDNPGRWFYQRLGGRMAMDMEIPFAGENVVQRAFVWDPIDRLLTATAKGAG
jgi:GNAT superfamily N-acetyltransferase